LVNEKYGKWGRDALVALPPDPRIDVFRDEGVAAPFPIPHRVL
jgi:hypothetical protein